MGTEKMDKKGLKKQLFLLHFAGGNCYSFQFLKPHLEARYEIHALELPGRGKRMAEGLLREREAAVSDYCKQIKALRNDAPFLIYGHSMGALLGYHVAHQLKNEGQPPKALIVSGNAGPGVLVKKERYQMSDAELREELRVLGGVPEEVLINDELFRFFTPSLRADFEVVEKTNDLVFRQLQIPVHALMGSAEETVDRIENWRNFTKSAFQYEVLEGNHFFIFDHPQKLAKTILESDDQAVVHEH